MCLTTDKQTEMKGGGCNRKKNGMQNCSQYKEGFYWSAIYRNLTSIAQPDTQDKTS